MSLLKYLLDKWFNEGLEGFIIKIVSLDVWKSNSIFGQTFKVNMETLSLTFPLIYTKKKILTYKYDKMANEINSIVFTYIYCHLKEYFPKQQSKNGIYDLRKQL